MNYVYLEKLKEVTNNLVAVGQTTHTAHYRHGVVGGVHRP